MQHNEIYPKFAKTVCGIQLPKQLISKSTKRRKKKLLKEIKHLPVKPDLIFSRQKLLEAEKLFKLTIKKLVQPKNQIISKSST